MPPVTGSTESERGTPQALLFDLGGVILDVHLERTLAYWASAAALPALDADQLRSRFGEDEAYRRFECGAADAGEFYAVLGSQLGISLPQDAWHAGWLAMLGQVRADMAGLLAKLSAELPLFLFSNTNAVHHAVWRHSCADVLRHFRTCFVSHELGARKPNRQAFDAVVASIGVPASSILFLDDLQANVDGARGAGLRAERVTNHGDAVHALGRHGIVIVRQ